VVFLFMDSIIIWRGYLGRACDDSPVGPLSGQHNMQLHVLVDLRVCNFVGGCRLLKLSVQPSRKMLLLADIVWEKKLFKWKIKR
jgi:hypothetical protein